VEIIEKQAGGSLLFALSYRKLNECQKIFAGPLNPSIKVFSP
jgi:hypothetical protein